jgi:hypothetical protein
MNDIIIWIIIIAFYAPLHYMLPVLFLFITGQENEDTRKALVHRALIDSTLSMLLAFAIAIVLTITGHVTWSMLVLLISMPTPFIRITRHRKEISGESG